MGEADVVKSHGRFVWYELISPDPEAAKAFYTEVLGWQPHDAGHDYTLFSTGGTTVSGLTSLTEDARKMGVRPSWLGYVGVDDVDAAAGRIRQLGGTVYPPREIPNISRLCVAIDPQMATIGLFKWLDSHRAPPEMSAPGGIGWHELLAEDWEKAWPFYSELFGWQRVQADNGEGWSYQPFAVGEDRIGGMFKKPPFISSTFWLYYFNVGDIDDAAKRVKAGGGAILEGPVEVPGHRWVLQCTDPQGAVFALEGKRRHDGLGYFERVTSRDRSDPRSGIACIRYG
jgi:predicted enzyme related to lactoylglutathione lyase